MLMRPFLQRLAEQLIHHHAHEMDRIAVVLPGKRAGLHLRKYLAQANGSALWSPEVLDMGGFTERATGMAQGGTLDLTFLLYEAHRSIRSARAEAFAEFLEWAPITLRDMSEVDAHLIDRDALYRDLREYHELEEWSFRLGELSPGQARLNAHWKSTGDLHTAFAALMNERRVGTSGHLARTCAAAAAGGTLHTPWIAVWFAGLNALDPANTAVIAALQKSGVARVAWDADPFYLDDRRQEAGRYLHRSMAALGKGEIEPRSGILGTTRHIRKVHAPHPLAQTTYVAERLAGLTPEERARTAVVLADEALLLPLLEQLPADIGPLNVTMGMPLAALPVSSLTDAYVDLLASCAADGSWPLALLLSVLGHPFLNEGQRTAQLVQALHGLQQAFVDQKSLVLLAKGVGSPHLEAMAVCTASAHAPAPSLAERFVNLFSWAKACAPQDRSIQEQLFQMARLQKRLDHILERADLGPLDLRTYAAVRSKLLQEERIAFLGEPLRGSQVMGVLETRALDHERLIMLSVNEGVMPRTNGQQSWIPFHLRKHLGLPLPADAEAISAYHFHRAMQQATDVEWILTDGGTEHAEPSRFAAQWAHEVIGRSNTTLESLSVAPFLKVRSLIPVHVAKDTAVLERLHTLCTQGLSPSALGTWCRCPLDFYFKYVLGIREVNVADGTLGSDVLGDAVHHVLQDLFTPFVGKPLLAIDIKDMPAKVPRLLTDRLAQRFTRSALEQGHFRLRREMATKAVQNYLEAEAARCGTTATTLLAVEEKVSALLPNGVLLKGRCDRVDERLGSVTVLDMKTGGTRAEDLRLAQLDRSAIGPGKRYALQLLIYSWAFLRSHPEVAEVSAGIIPLQRPTQAEGEFLNVGQSTLLTSADIPAMETLLTELVNELLDPGTPFEHDPDSAYCTCCASL